MKEFMLPLICLLVVGVCMAIPPKTPVSKAVELPTVTHVIQKQYVPAPIQWMPQPQPHTQPLRPIKPRSGCCPNGQCMNRRYAFPILGAPFRLVGRLVLGVRRRAIMNHNQYYHGERYANYES